MPAPPQTAGRAAASPPAPNGGRRAEAGAAVGGNRVLASLPSREAKALGSVLEPFRLEPGAVLLEPGERVERVVFPDSGVVRLSMVRGPHGARRLRLGGARGLGRAARALRRRRRRRGLPGGGADRRRGAGRAPRIAPRPSAQRIRVPRRGPALRRGPTRRHRRGRRLQRAPPLRQRAARWLLAVQDRAGPGFSLTQEELAEMLGARRPTVNAVLQRFKAEGIVRATRGRIAVSDATGLERAACACRRRVLDARGDLLLRFWPPLAEPVQGANAGKTPQTQAGESRAPGGGLAFRGMSPALQMPQS